MPPAPNPRRLKGPALAALIATAVAGIAPLSMHFEGKRNRVYLDPVGIPTYCYGETKNPDPMRVYSDDECGRLFRKRMAADFAPAIVRCVPDFADPRRLWQFQAALDASYNAGPAAVCRSPMARAFNAGRWNDGCNAFPGWYVTARGVKLAGLVRRREAEKRHCLTGKH